MVPRHARGAAAVVLSQMMPHVAPHRGTRRGCRRLRYLRVEERKRVKEAEGRGPRDMHPFCLASVSSRSNNVVPLRMYFARVKKFRIHEAVFERESFTVSGSTLTASLRAASACERSRASAWCILSACSGPLACTPCCWGPVEPWVPPPMSPLLPILIAAASDAMSTGERLGDTEFCSPNGNIAIISRFACISRR